MKHSLQVLASALLLTTSAFAAPGKPYSDEWVEGRLKGALDFNSYFDSTDIDVDAENGVVELTGDVPSENQKMLAENIALKLEGVKRVENKIVVNEKIQPRSRSEMGQSIADATTTAVVKTKLTAYKLTNATKIDVDTKSGVVMLNGAVENSNIKETAENIALDTTGVVDVKNNLKIENPKSFGDKVENNLTDASQAVSDSWISTKVRTMLTFSSKFPGSKIDVTTDKGIVYLDGIARSNEQKDKLSQEVAQVNGVNNVKNRMEIRKSIS